MVMYIENELGKNAVEDINIPVDKIVKNKYNLAIDEPNCLVTPLKKIIIRYFSAATKNN